MRCPQLRYSVMAMLSLSVGLLSSQKVQAWELQTQYQKGPDSPIKLQWFPRFKAPTNKTPKALAKAYLMQESSAFSLTKDLSELSPIEEKTSLLGTHITYQQMHENIPIEGAHITLSFLKDGTLYQVYNTLVPKLSSFAKQRARITKEQAFDRAWEALAVKDDLYEEPKAMLTYVVTPEGQLRLVYHVELSTLAPYGAWMSEVDAQTGVVLSIEDQRISHKPKQKPDAKTIRLQKANLDRRTTFLRWQEKQKQQATIAAAETREGKARVFDPDPRTTLNDRTLNDESASDLFKEAYFERTLQDLSFDGNQYSLTGPWVKIIDFDPPRTSPSKTNDGFWNFSRGNNGFNDAMTYFHVDQSQRYMQSLGFKGTSGIQFGPIEVDTDGVNGDDNSYFQPSTNRLSFGHGCVDDNEDADVILHEYGHAIHFSINPRWSGGDTGAIGEGFGDYWAASYSISTPNGDEYAADEVYSWDGHGSNDECWPGRILNAFDARYEHTRNYSAHSTIPGGFQSDELWATPLFQALQTLRREGVAREEVDRIILQAQFGLGSQIKMRDMAQSILANARLLYPEGPHFQVFKTNFLRHNIIEEPRPILEASLLEVIDASGDGILDPGEAAELRIKLANKGTLAATAIELTLNTTQSEVVLDPRQSAYPDLDIGQNALNTTALGLELSPAISCGSLVSLTAEITYAGGAKLQLPIQLRVGKAVGIKQSVTKGMTIPDNDTKGIEIPMNVTESGTVSDQLKVSLQIKHPFRGDLRVQLQAPNGQRVTLHERTGFGEDDLRGVYPTSLQPKDPLSRLVGVERTGTWKLIVQDLASTDVGSFESWGIEDISRYSCQTTL